MRILLINPPVFDPGRFRRTLEEKPIETYTMPIGLGYLAAILLREGFEVQAVDAYNMSWQAIERMIKDFAPHVVGISVLTDQRASVYRLIALVKEMQPEIKVVLGGAHATIMHDQLLRHFPVDAVVLGEGERTMLELVRAWEAGEDLQSVKGIAMRNNGRVVKTEPRLLIQDLDTIPFPAYQFFDLDMYAGWELHQKVAGALGYRDIDRHRSAALVTSRGCPWNCSFCSVALTWGRKWRARSACNIVDEIEWLVKQYDCRIIDIVDDIFSVDQQRVMEVADEILDRKLDIMWGFETGVRYVSEAMLQKVAKAGCRFIIYGVESASSDVMKHVSKKTGMEHIIRAFELTRQVGIATGAFIMVGNPGETEMSIDKTIRMLKIIRPDVIVNQILMVFPGTRQYAQAVEDGFIDDRYWLTELPAPYYDKHHTLRKMIRWHRKIAYYPQSRLEIAARTIRDGIELYCGLNISRRGVQRVPNVPKKSLWHDYPIDALMQQKLTNL